MSKTTARQTKEVSWDWQVRLPDSKPVAPTRPPATEDKPSPTQRTILLLTNLAKQRGSFTKETP